MPRQTEKRAVQKPQQSPEAAPLCRGLPVVRLLLVDDEAEFVDALAFRLRTRGLECTVAYSGEDALRLMRLHEPEVVLLDLNMPGMHGLETLRHLKSARPDLEVILLTGAADIGMAARGMRRGAGDYLVKPVDLSDLLESVNKARRRSSEHRERLRAAEAGRLMALGALAAGVGHEINNPLQLIMQGSEWLCELVEEAKQDGPDLAAMEKAALLLQAQARKAGAITAQLLDLARQTRARRAYTIVPKLLDKILEPMRVRALALGIAITADIPHDLPLLPCSPAEMEPVLIHLLRNALDSIEAHCRAGGKVGISAFEAEGFVVIRIADNGEGISPEHAAHIFEPFFSTRPVGRGAGLGLTLCHSIISALRGNIRYLPAPDGGAVFLVDIPVSKDTAASRPGGED